MRIFWRLLGFLRPYRGPVAASFVLASGAMGATVLIPYLTGQAINGIREHNRHAREAYITYLRNAGHIAAPTGSS